MYYSVESDIFGHAYILHSINPSDFSNPPIPVQVVYLGCALLHLLVFAYPLSERYPDLFAVLNVLLTTPVFVFTWL